MINYCIRFVMYDETFVLRSTVAPVCQVLHLFYPDVYVRFYDFRYCWQGTYCSQYQTSYATARLTEFYVVLFEDRGLHYKATCNTKLYTRLTF